MEPPVVSERRAETRRWLIDAAEELIAERGVNGSTVVQICERAGFTRGAFYSNFSTKDELCLALLRRQLGHYLQALGAAAATLTAGGDAKSPPGEDERVARALELFLAAAGDDSRGLLVRMEMRLHALRTPTFRTPHAADRGGTRAANRRHHDPGCREVGAAPADAAPAGGHKTHAAYEVQASGRHDAQPAPSISAGHQALRQTFAECVELADHA